MKKTMANINGNALIAVAVLIVALAGIGFAIYALVRKNAGERADKKELETAKSDSEKLTGSTVTTSLNFDRICEDIYAACKGIGTDEDLLFAAMKRLRTQADYEYLKTHWKVWYSNLGWTAYCSETLGGTIAGDLSAKEKSRLADELALQGITIDF